MTEDQRYGASPHDWNTLGACAGLTEDLLPVVSNLHATISPQSKMKGVGKTPSYYNGRGHAVGIASWTSKQATQDEIAEWQQQPDYGICIQTRRLRALDVDIEDEAAAKAIWTAIIEHLGIPTNTPIRQRSNTGKFLLPFYIEGDYAKRIIRTKAGIIEFLATGQQFVAVGTHTSGVRYEWSTGGVPSEFPTLTSTQFESLWQYLEQAFATEPSKHEQSSSRNTKLNEAITNDPIAQRLIDKGAVVSTERDGRLHIICPFADQHTGDTGESSTTYFPASTGGYERGHFVCLHSHCAERTDTDFALALGVDTRADDFEDLSDEEIPDQTTQDTKQKTFEVINCFDTIDKPPLAYHIKGVLPAAALAVLFGEPGSGKTFVALDLAFAIARGVAWRGKKVKQGRVVYVAAEDAGGVFQRTKAYLNRHSLTQDIPLPLDIIDGRPNLLKVEDVKAIIDAIKAGGSAALVILDTFAQVTAGANENSGEDVSLAMAAATAIYKATGGTVMLVHHSGKDASKGARGHSSLKGNCDAELEVTRFNDSRVLRVSKLKNAEDNTSYGFGLEVVDLGTDADGDAITSCVVTETSVSAAAGRGHRLGVVEKTVLTKLEELQQGLQDGGSEQQDVALESLIVAALDELPQPADGKKDKRRYHVRRAIRGLVDGNVLQEIGENITFVDLK